MKPPKPHTSYTDEELLHRWVETEDNQWIGYLLQRYTLLLFGVGMKYLKDKTLAQDAVQQVFLKVLTQLKGKEIQNFKAFLYIMMRNHCLQYLRDKHTLAGEEAIPAQLPEPDEDQEPNYTPNELTEALNTLNPEQQTAIRMFYLEKLSYQQIMQRTGYTFMQVKSSIQNGKRNLKHYLLKKIKEQ